MSKRDDLLAMVDERRVERVLFSPLADALFAIGVVGKDWVSEADWDDQVAAAERCGYHPRFVRGSAPDLHCNPALEVVHELVEEGDEAKRFTQTVVLPGGDLVREMVDRRGEGMTQLNDWLDLPDGLEHADRASQQVLRGKRDAAIREEYGAWVEQVKPFGVTQVQVELPYYLFGLAGFADRPVMGWMLHRERYARSMELAEAAIHRVAELLIDVGVDFIWVGASGTELLSPEIWERAIVPQAERLRDHVHRLGGRLHFHCCGQSQLWVESGYYDRIAMDVVETLSCPPAGDVEDLAAARAAIKPSIVTQGNIDLGLLLNGTPEECAEAAQKVITATEGYSHLVSGADDLLNGTPVANVVAVQEVCAAADHI